MSGSSDSGLGVGFALTGHERRNLALAPEDPDALVEQAVQHQKDHGPKGPLP